MKSNSPDKETIFDPQKIKKRLGPEGRILVFSLFFGLAAAPALAFLVFKYMGTVPQGYSVSRFYSDVRRDLYGGVWVAWALVLCPYALFQIFRVTKWAVRTARASIGTP